MLNALSDPTVLMLLALLLPAATLDILYHRIPNFLSYPAIVAGLLLGTFQGGLSGLGQHFLGLLAGGVPLYLMFLSGSLGGGDVKLMAAVGAITGFPMALNALITSILVGGLCAALILIWQGRLFAMMQFSWLSVWHRVGVRATAPPPLSQRRDAFPFGIAIAIGTLLTAIGPLLSGQA